QPITRDMLMISELACDRFSPALQRLTTVARERVQCPSLTALVPGTRLGNNCTIFCWQSTGCAVAFLRTHPCEGGPITITLWGNDILEFVQNVCNLDPACIQSGAPGVIAHINTNLAFILGQLRAAAPDAEIIMTGAWDVIGFNAFAFADPLIE